MQWLIQAIQSGNKFLDLFKSALSINHIMNGLHLSMSVLPFYFV